MPFYRGSDVGYQSCSVVSNGETSERKITPARCDLTATLLNAKPNNILAPNIGEFVGSAPTGRVVVTEHLSAGLQEHGHSVKEGKPMVNTPNTKKFSATTALYSLDGVIMPFYNDTIKSRLLLSLYKSENIDLYSRGKEVKYNISYYELSCMNSLLVILDYMDIKERNKLMHILHGNPKVLVKINDLYFGLNVFNEFFMIDLVKRKIIDYGYLNDFNNFCFAPHFFVFDDYMGGNLIVYELSRLDYEDLNKLMHMLNGNQYVTFRMYRGKLVHLDGDKFWSLKKLFDEQGFMFIFYDLNRKCVVDENNYYYHHMYRLVIDIDFISIITQEAVLKKTVRKYVFYDYECDINLTEAQMDTIYNWLGPMPYPSHWIHRITNLTGKDSVSRLKYFSSGISNKTMHSTNGNTALKVAAIANVMVFILIVFIISNKQWNKLMHSINGNHKLSVNEYNDLLRNFLASAPSVIKPTTLAYINYFSECLSRMFKFETEFVALTTANGLIGIIDLHERKCLMELFDHLTPISLSVKTQVVKGKTLSFMTYVMNKEAKFIVPKEDLASDYALTVTEKQKVAELSEARPATPIPVNPLKEKEEEVPVLGAMNLPLSPKRKTISAPKQKQFSIFEQTQKITEQLPPIVYQSHKLRDRKYTLDQDSWHRTKQQLKDEVYLTGHLKNINLMDLIERTSYLKRTLRKPLDISMYNTILRQKIVKLEIPQQCSAKGKVIRVNCLGDLETTLNEEINFTVPKQLMNMDTVYAKPGTEEREAYFEIIVKFIGAEEGKATSYALLSDIEWLSMDGGRNFKNDSEYCISTPIQPSQSEEYSLYPQTQHKDKHLSWYWNDSIRTKPESKPVPQEYARLFKSSKFMNCILPDPDTVFSNVVTDDNTYKWLVTNLEGSSMIEKDVHNWNRYKYACKFSFSDNEMLCRFILSLMFSLLGLYFLPDNLKWLSLILWSLPFLSTLKVTSGRMYQDFGPVTLENLSIFNPATSNLEVWNRLVVRRQFIMYRVLIFKFLISYDSNQIIDERYVNECWEKMKGNQTWKERYATCDVVIKMMQKNLKIKTTNLMMIMHAGQEIQVEMPIAEATIELVCSYSKLKLDFRPTLGFLIAVR